MHNFPNKNYLFPILNKVFNRIPNVILLNSNRHSICIKLISTLRSGQQSNTNVHLLLDLYFYYTVILSKFNPILTGIA